MATCKRCNGTAEKRSARSPYAGEFVCAPCERVLAADARKAACDCPTPCPMVCPYIEAHGRQYVAQGEYVDEEFCSACLDLDRPADLVPACEVES